MRLLPSANRETRTPAIVCMTLLAAILLLTNLGAIHQFTRAEVYFAETAREMLASGDWLTPRFCDKIFFDKPPLSYWVIASSFRGFGASEASARFSSALAGVLLVVSITLFAMRYYSVSSGFLSGLVLLSSFGFWSFARYAMSDMFLTLFLTIALLSYHEALRSEKKWKAWIIAGHTSLALAFNAKGPVGPILAGFAVLLMIVWNRRLEWRRLFYPGALVIFLLIALPWYVAVYLKHTSFFVDYFFYGENVSRFFGTKYATDHRPSYYIEVLLTLFFPWCLWLPASIAIHLSEKNSDPAKRPFTTAYLVCWAAAPIIFFSFSRCQLDYYILPSYPAMAILVGSALSRIASEEYKYARTRKAILIFIAITLIVLSYLFWKTSVAMYPDLQRWFHVGVPVVAILSAFLLFGTLKQRYQQAFPYVLTSIMVCILFLLSTLLYPLSERYQTVPRFARAISEEEKNHATRVATGFEVALWHADVRFYTGLRVEALEDQQQVKKFVQRPGPALLILPESRLRDAFDDSKSYRILDRGPYLGHRMPGSNFYDRPVKPSSVVLVAVNF